MKPEQLMDIIRSRRSVRQFKKIGIPKKDIEKVITAASWAPSGTNKQNWEFIVISSKKVKEEMKHAVDDALAEAVSKIKLPDAKNVFGTYGKNFIFFREAPVVIAVVKKPYESVIHKILKRYGVDSPKPSSDVQGPSAAIQNLLLMAHALGYGTCWMTGPMIAKVKLEKILKIQPPDELMALIPMGRISVQAACPPRKKSSEITRYF